MTFEQDVLSRLDRIIELLEAKQTGVGTAAMPKSKTKLSPDTHIQIGRTYVTVGSLVQVPPSQPRKRNGFVAPILAIYGGDPYEVDVRDPKSGNLRTLPVTKLRAKRQPKGT